MWRLEEISWAGAAGVEGGRSQQREQNMQRPWGREWGGVARKFEVKGGERAGRPECQGLEWLGDWEQGRSSSRKDWRREARARLRGLRGGLSWGHGNGESRVRGEWAGPGCGREREDGTRTVRGGHPADRWAQP